MMLDLHHGADTIDVANALRNLHGEVTDIATQVAEGIDGDLVCRLGEVAVALNWIAGGLELELQVAVQREDLFS